VVFFLSLEFSRYFADSSSTFCSVRMALCFPRHHSRIKYKQKPASSSNDTFDIHSFSPSLFLSLCSFLPSKSYSSPISELAVQSSGKILGHPVFILPLYFISFLWYFIL